MNETRSNIVAKSRAKRLQDGYERFEVLLPPAQALRLRQLAQERSESRNKVVCYLLTLPKNRND